MQNGHLALSLTRSQGHFLAHLNSPEFTIPESNAFH